MWECERGERKREKKREREREWRDGHFLAAASCKKICSVWETLLRTSKIGGLSLSTGYKSVVRKWVVRFFEAVHFWKEVDYLTNSSSWKGWLTYIIRVRWPSVHDIIWHHCKSRWIHDRTRPLPGVMAHDYYNVRTSLELTNRQIFA